MAGSDRVLEGFQQARILIAAPVLTIIANWRMFSTPCLPVSLRRKMVKTLNLRELLQAGFAALTDLQRNTLEMFFWEGYSLREISSRLQETHGNTRNH